jgi:hypothetical protein
MRIEVKRNAIIVIPENEQDRAFIEDSLSVKANGQRVQLERVDNVALGYAKTDEFCLKSVSATNEKAP